MKRANVAIKTNCHSRKLLSGIYNACCCKTKEKSLLNEYVEDPRQHSSGMTPHFITTRGFTLIELLVVVLIIGILAAVAVPQYQIAVAKSKYMKLVSVMASLRAAEELYYLANGKYIDNTTVLDIDSLAGCSSVGAGIIVCQDFQIDVNAGYAFENPMGSMINTLAGLHYVYFQNHSSTNPGERECWAENEFAQKVCKSLGGVENGTRRWQQGQTVRAFTRYSLP